MVVNFVVFVVELIEGYSRTALVLLRYAIADCSMENIIIRSNAHIVLRCCKNILKFLKLNFAIYTLKRCLRWGSDRYPIGEAASIVDTSRLYQLRSARRLRPRKSRQ